MQRTILAICSDLHGGHRHGLLNPATSLEEINEKGEKVKDYHPELTPIQRYLWETYIEQIGAVRNLAQDDPLIVILNGDMTAGNKYPQLLVSDRIADQMLIGAANIEPWFGLAPKAVRLIKGTGAHVFGQGTSEILITQLLKTLHPETSIEVYDHSLISIGGMDVDISHHGPPPGSRAWLKGNEVRYYLKSLMFDELSAGKKPPRLILRGHYHDYIKETVNIRNNGDWYESTLVITPSFAYVDNHGRQSVKSPARITHGMVVVEIVNGELLQITPLTKTVDIRSRETLIERI